MELVVAAWCTAVNEDASDASVSSGAPGQADAAVQSGEGHQRSFELFGNFLKDRAEEFAHVKDECCFPQSPHSCSWALVHAW